MNVVLPSRILLVSFAVALCGYAGLLLAIPPGYATAIFPPPGIALAALLAWGYGLWPGVWLGSFCLNVLITYQKSGVLEFGLPAAIAVGTTLQALAGTWLIRRFVGYPAALDDKRSIALFFLCGAIAACVISASVGVSSLLATGAIGFDEVAYSWWTWYVGDALGVLIVAPLTLIAIGEPRPAWRARRVNLAVPLAITLAIVVAVFVSFSHMENQRQDRDFLDSVRASAWIVLAAGVLFAGLLGSLLLLVTGRGVRAQQLVDQRGNELRQAKSAIAKNEQLVRAAFEASPVGMLVVDADGCIEEASARLPAMFGYTREALLGRPVETLLPEWSVPSLENSERIGAGAPRGAIEQRGRRADGSEFLVDVMKNAMPSDDGTRAVASVEDITERKRVEALEKQKIRLETELTERDKTETAIARKNRELETLLHVTSHDLKEPLRAIEGFSRLVHDRYGNHIDEKGQDFLRRVVNAAQRMNRLLDEILNLSRAQRMGPPTEAIESEKAVREALKRIDSAMLDSGVKLRVEGDLPQLMADRTWVTEAVYNLVVNALKFKSDGQVPDIEIAPYRGNGELGIVVRDRGPGVAPEHAERIFELFQRAVGREIEGTGAGLAIVRLVAEQHGGRAWVRPREGGGSEFIITFASPVSTVDG